VDLATLITHSLVPDTVERCKVVLSGAIERAVVLKGIVATKGARAAIEAAGGRVE
jgi:large subunit ribosomal protein L15